MNICDVNDTPAAVEPVMEQVPTETQETTTPATEATTPGLPAGYLSDGYLATPAKGKKYLRPAYVADYAEQIANTLSANMKPSDFAALVRILKRKKSKNYPFEARQSALSEAHSKARALVHSRKAPPLLLEFFKASAAAIHDDDDWSAFFTHVEVIYNLIVSEGD